MYKYIFTQIRKVTQIHHMIFLNVVYLYYLVSLIIIFKISGVDVFFLCLTHAYIHVTLIPIYSEPELQRQIYIIM